MRFSQYAFTLVSFYYSITLSVSAATTPVTPSSFRRRGYHASAVLDGWFYIDGGEFSYSSGNNVTRDYLKSLLAIDLSKDWTNDAVSILSTEKPSKIPSLTHGGLWVDSHIIYTGFAGRRSRYDTENDVLDKGLWAFTPDGRGGGSWMTVDANNGPSWSEIERPYSSLMASGAGAGIFVGGWVANASSKRDPGYKASPISGLLKYNFTTKEITNTSVTGVAMAGNSQMGGMHYVPNFGPQGLFLSLGGQQIRTSESRSDRYLNMSYVEIYNPETGKWDVGQSALDPETYLNMTYVQIYDPATGKWHEQKTSGHPPEPRKEFCIAGIASQSNTYEILVYAGWNGDLGPRSIPFDGAYVLSLPSFRWIKAEYEARSPRHALSCDSVGGAQILVVGGVDTLHGGPQDPYDAVFEAKDPFAQGLIIFNMSSLSWEVSYVAKPHPYDHTSLLRQWYSSNPRKPEFNNTDLKALFDHETFPAKPAEAKSHTKSIIGGVIGAVFGSIVIAVAAVIIVRRRKASSTLDIEQSEHPELHGDMVLKSELPNSEVMREMSSQHERFELPDQNTVSEMQGEGDVAELEGEKKI